MGGWIVKRSIQIRPQSASVLLSSLVLGMTILPFGSYSQDARSTDVGQVPLDVDSSSSLEARISEVPPEVISSYIGRGQVAPTNYELTSEEKQKFSAALEVLTPLHTSILQRHLRSISFVEGLPANAQTIRVNTGGSEEAFDLVFNARVLGETLSEFATRKERQLFETGDSRLTVSVAAGSMDAIAFVLAHEATHIVDFVLGLTPPPTPPGVQTQQPYQTPFSGGVWESAMTPAGAYRGGLLGSMPLRTGGGAFNIEQAQALYEDLERTPFVSVYASLMVTEDMAELVAWRQMTEIYRQPYRIEVRNDADVIYTYEPMKSPLVRSRLNQLELFDSAESIESQ